MEKQSILLAAAVNVPAMLIMAAIVWRSYSVTKKQRTHFCFVFCTVVVIVILELFSTYINGTNPRWRWLNIISHYLGFSLIPLVPVACAGAISDYRHSRWLLWLLGLHAVLLLFTVPFQIVYSVDANNCYFRCRHYWIFVAVYVAAVAHLAYVTLRLNLEYQNNSPFIAGILVAFLIFSTVLQLLNPKIYITWTCASMLAVIYYVYCTELWLQVDGLTGLLNHGSYLRRMNELPPDCTLVLFDVDKFKEVNDGHGHLFGDASLKWVSKCIRSVYGSSGLCYRIGGDEFAVIVTKSRFDPEEKYQEFEKLIRANRVARPGMPGVSLGWSVYRAGMSSKELVTMADQKMYQNKHSKPSA